MIARRCGNKNGVFLELLLRPIFLVFDFYTSPINLNRAEELNFFLVWPTAQIYFAAINGTFYLSPFHAELSILFFFLFWFLLSSWKLRQAEIKKNFESFKSPNKLFFWPIDYNFFFAQALAVLYFFFSKVLRRLINFQVSSPFVKRNKRE